MTKIPSKNKYTKEQNTSIVSLLKFDTDKVIKHFNKKIKNSKKDWRREPNPLWIKQWEHIIKDIKYVEKCVKGEV